jgi:cytochrome c oxidase subunit 2
VSPHDIFSPAGPQAKHILDLWWLTFLVCAGVFLTLLVAFGYALRRGSKGGSPEGAARAIVASAVGVSTLLLLLLIAASVATDRALAKLPADGALTVEVTGHRWWWELRYQDEQPSREFVTANELYIPVGRPVRLKLKADDVIHSFWVPSLHGKKDLIPGRETELLLRADKAGEYGGQCAEFCGAQHAKMAFIVFALPQAQFDAWAERQRKPAAEPADKQHQRGRDLFVQGTCAMCHAVQGTPANGRKAPDLTHLADRRTLAAGALPNQTEKLKDWIKDPHQTKPGVNMPAHQDLKPDELQAIAAWLGSLQ